MQIEGIHIRTFGRVKDLELTQLGSPLVVFLGPNESGKSTLAHFVGTMLYGFHPASADSHPYRPWDGERLEGELRYGLSDGRKESVFRKLGSSPDGYLISEQRKALRNRPIPAASHISRGLFEAVYALTLSEIASVRERSWDEIQDRLLGSLGLQSLQPVRKVLKDLDEASAMLWRNNRRGKPKARQIEGKLRELKSEAREAHKRDRRVRKLVDRRGELDEKLRRLEQDKKKVLRRLCELEQLVPVANLVRRMEEAMTLSGERAEWESLPDNPRERISEVKATIDSANLEKRNLQSRLEAKAEIMSKCGPEEEKLAGLVDAIGEWEQQLKHLEETAERVVEEEQVVKRTSGSIEALSKQVLARELDEEIERRVLSLSIPELRNRVRDYEDAVSTLSELRQNLDRSKEGGIDGSYLWSLAVAVSGLLPLILGIVQDSQILLVVGSCLAVLASLLAVRTYARRGQINHYRASVIEPLEHDARQKAEKIAGLLNGIPIPSGELKKPDAYLTVDLEALQTALEKRDMAEQKIANLQMEAAGIQSRFQEWLQINGLSLEVGSSVAASRLLSRARVAERRVSEAREARAAAQELEASLDQVSTALAAQRMTLQNWSGQLSRLGQGEIEAGIRAFEERRDAYRSAELHRRTLDSDFPGWSGLIEQRPVGAEFLGSLVAEEDQLRRRLDKINDWEKEALAERAALDPELEYARTARCVVDIESEICSLQEELESIKWRRDRLALLANIIREADRLFREKHQPDVLKRAGEFLSLISGGTYRRIDQDEVSGAFEVFRDDGGRTPLPVAAPLSQGTRDQIYLALRFAIVEHLDKEQERLPLLLDEILVNWDSKRRQNGYSVLTKVLDTRQVLLFTCHPWLADELVTSLGAHCVDFSELGTPPDAAPESEDRLLLV